MNSWFGPDWGAPVCRMSPHIETPLGLPCSFCRDPIEEGEAGFMQGVFSKAGATVEPIHLECQMRSVIGSVGHLKRRCSCYGGHESDPPGMSRHDAARAAFALFNEQSFGVNE